MPRRAVYAMAGAALAVALLLLTWFLAFHVGFFRNEDPRILNGFAGLHRLRVDAIAHSIATLCDPNPYVYFAGAVVLLALLRRRPGIALVVALIIFGANVTTQVLKPLLAAPRVPVLGGEAPILPASWPSGHATAAMSLALSLVLAAPARLRPLAAALGAAFAVAVSYSFLTLGWHYPSDVIGGFLVATAWTLLGIAAVFTVRARRAHEPSADVPSVREALVPAAGALLAALGLGGLIALARPHEVITYAQAHRAFVVGAGAIAAMGLALATAVMLAVRR